MVIGDLMVDHYIKGRVERISPEAPVPVVEVQNEEYRLGGAANVALNLKQLGANLLLCGVCGSDAASQVLFSQLQEAGIGTEGVFCDTLRKTTLKTRINAVNQQIVRLDYENQDDIDIVLEDRIASWIKQHLAQTDAVIIEDYNKGLLTASLIAKILSMTGSVAKPVFVDPKFKNFFAYVGVDVFKPNFGELEKNLGAKFQDNESFVAAAKSLRERIAAKYLIVTRGSKGLFIFGADGIKHLPTFAKDVYDVSGAGDTVISVLCLAYCAGCDISEAATIANHAAGVVCGKYGTAFATAEEIVSSYHDHQQD